MCLLGNTEECKVRWKIVESSEIRNVTCSKRVAGVSGYNNYTELLNRLLGSFGHGRWTWEGTKRALPVHSCFLPSLRDILH